LIGRDIVALLQRRDRLLQHLLVKLVADFADMAGLFIAKKIARAANIKIVRGKLEAGAQAVE
jgi:hypothetical protein